MFGRMNGKAGFLAVMAAVCCLMIGGTPARAAEDADTVAEAQLARFYDALSGKGDLGAVLGDAFQIMRTDGTRYDRAGYISRHPAYTSYRLSDVKASLAGDVLTVSYFAAVNGQVEDTARATAGDPRLAVFVRAGGEWKLQSIANLGLGIAANPKPDAEKAVEAWVGAVMSGDLARIKGVLAPEFQIIRDDGSAYDAEGYLKSNLPKFEAEPSIQGLVATGFGDYLVARYTIDVGKQKGTGVRLTVFRKSGNAWLVVAHANLGGRVH
ncbi:MAG: nuclear transport factor 2 family protein [Rhizobiales bacterium]|nr:nuclear transport factor 2 family protein [Hyphomicrobiales bacterium]